MSDIKTGTPTDIASNTPFGNPSDSLVETNTSDNCKYSITLFVFPINFMFFISFYLLYNLSYSLPVPNKSNILSFTFASINACIVSSILFLGIKLLVDINTT